MANRYAAFDLGAESGRVMLGELKDGRLELEEIHRFPTGVFELGSTLRWDLPRIYSELRRGLLLAAERGPIQGVSCDSWGVDLVFHSASEPMLTLPYNYRDPRNEAAMQKALQEVPADRVFEETGIQFMPINSLYQLVADRDRRPWVFREADGFLMVADYLMYLFSGVASQEETNASTTQLYNPRSRSWSGELIRDFGLPEKIFPKIVAPGTVLGPVLPTVCEHPNLKETKVIAGCSHDTAAAVAAVPARGRDWAFLSSGTWSLLGVETGEPVITPKSREHNFTNEVGFGGTIRLLKNIAGLWMVQECRREWEAEGASKSYAELTAEAEAAPALRSLADPGYGEFLKPGAMPRQIIEFCRATGQPVPSSRGEIVRAALEGLALQYRRVLEMAREVWGGRVDCLHIVGGGIQNKLLNRFTADATGKKVVAGPVEATAAGTVLVQAVALGHLPSLEAVREVVRNSFPLETYEPAEGGAWDEAYGRFASLKY